MTIKISIPSQTTEELRPRITIIGIGGAGGNAANNMIESKLEGVSYLVANTDGQALSASRADRKIQLGRGLTQGLGAGAKPEIGRLATEDSMDEITAEIADSHMVFITAGMGGGTGTGGAPIIAKAAREMGILTVGVVTKPFDFEGTPRMQLAEQGIEALQKHVDTLIVIPNQNLFGMADRETTLAEAFARVDAVLYQAVSGITNLIMKTGIINCDFADVQSVMCDMGRATMGCGEASGDNRAKRAAKQALHNPLLGETSIRGARAILINITGGPDMTLFEAEEAANYIRKRADAQTKITFGAILDDGLSGHMQVSVVATGMEEAMLPFPLPEESVVSGAEYGDSHPYPPDPTQDHAHDHAHDYAQGHAQDYVPDHAHVHAQIGRSEGEKPLVLDQAIAGDAGKQKVGFFRSLLALITGEPIAKPMPTPPNPMPNLASQETAESGEASEASEVSSQPGESKITTRIPPRLAPIVPTPTGHSTGHNTGHSMPPPAHASATSPDHTPPTAHAGHGNGADNDSQLDLDVPTFLRRQAGDGR